MSDESTDIHDYIFNYGTRTRNKSEHKLTSWPPLFNRGQATPSYVKPSSFCCDFFT